jgi:hypothetical protein
MSLDLVGDLIHLQKMHPTPWTLDSDTEPDEDVILDANGDEVTLMGVEAAVVAAVNALAELTVPQRPEQEGSSWLKDQVACDTIRAALVELRAYRAEDQALGPEASADVAALLDHLANDRRYQLRTADGDWVSVARIRAVADQHRPNDPED